MPTDRFIIQFDTNYRQAIIALDALGRKVSEIEARINSLNARSGGGQTVQTFNAIGQAATNASRGVASLGSSVKRAGFNAADVSKFTKNVANIRQQLADLERERRTFARSGLVFPDSKLTQMIRLYEQLGATGTRSLSNIRASQARLAADLSNPNKFFPSGLSLGLNRTASEIQTFQRQLKNAESGIARRQLFGRLPTEAQIGNALQASLALQERGFQGAADKVAKYSSALERGRFVSDSAARSFAFHARRVAEGIVIYEAFAQAVNLAANAISFVANTDREVERLSQVLGGLPESNADGFLHNLGQIAFDTNTPLNDLVSTTDLLAGVLKDLPGDVLSNVQAFQRLAGEFSNVLGPGQNQEQVTGQLAQVFRALKFTDVADFKNFLDFLVTSGHRSAFEISNIFDALAEVGPNAKLAGLDVNILTLALDNLVRTASGASGQELGNILKTALGRFLRPADQEKIQALFDKISGGLLQVKDSAGKVRPATDIFLDLVNAFKQGVVSADEANQVFSLLVGQLQPGQIGVVTKIFGAFLEAVDRAPDVAKEASDALKDLSDALTDTLAGRFGQFIRRLEQGLVEGRDAVKEFVDVFLNAGEAILGFVGFLGSGFFITLAKFGLLLAGLKFGQAILGSKLLKEALFEIQFAITSLVRGFTISRAAGVGMFGALKIAGGAFLASLGPLIVQLLVIKAIMDTIDFANKVGEQQAALSNQISQQASGANLAQLERIRQQIGSQLSEGAQRDQGFLPQKGFFDPGLTTGLNLGNFFNEALKEETTDPALLKSLAGINKLIDDLKSKGAGATVTLDQVQAAMGQTADGTSSLSDEQKQASEEWQQWLNQLNQTPGALDQVTRAETAAGEAARLNKQLADERVAALEELDSRLSDGTITEAEHAKGLDQINRISDLAARATAILGDKLGRIPQLEAAAAGGSDDLSKALFRQLLQSGDNIDQTEHLIDRLIKLAGAAAAAAAVAAANPIIIRSFIAPTETLNPSNLDKVHGGAGTFRIGQNSVINKGPVLTDAGAAATAAMQAILRQLGALFSHDSNSFLGSGAAGGGAGGSGGRTRTQTPILDIGKLKRSQLNDIIAIATRVMNRVPGGRAESKGDIVSLLKDARVFKNIHDIDERFLRIAIERLTDKMQRANELAEQRNKANGLLRNLTVNAGPLGALVSQPTAFGVAGSLAAGNGLNFDPRKGNFVINVPVQLKGLQPAQLQQLIYNIISKAIRDALRL